MSVEVLNTKAAIIAVSLAVGLPAAGYGIYRGVEYGVHAWHTKLVHTAHNMTYQVSDCGVSPSHGGTRWSATVLIHDANPDGSDQYGVQIQFLDETGKPVAWTKVEDVPSLNPGESKTMNVVADVNQDAPSTVTCVAEFFYKGHPAKDLSPLPMSR